MICGPHGSFTQGNDIRAAKCIEGLPPEAELISAHVMSFETGDLELCFRVPGEEKEGSLPERFDPVFQNPYTTYAKREGSELIESSVNTPNGLWGNS